MPITPRAATVTSGATTTSFTLVINASVQANDILVLACVNRDATADPTVQDNDTGGNTWSKLDNQNAATNGALTIWWKRATSGTASKTITASGFTGSCAGAVIPLVGASRVSNPFTGVTPVKASEASGTEQQSGITTIDRNSHVMLAVCCTSNDSTFSAVLATNPASITIHGQGTSTGGSDCSVIICGANRTDAGATGTISWSLAPNGTQASIAFVLHLAHVDAATIAAGSAPHAPTDVDVQAPTIGGATIASTVLVREPTVLPDQAVTAGTIGSTAFPYAPPTVIPDLFVTSGTIAAGAVPYEPTVAAERLIDGSTIGSGATLYGPNIVQTTLTVDILEGSTVRASRTYSAYSSFTKEIIILTAEEQAAFTSWADIRIRVTKNNDTVSVSRVVMINVEETGGVRVGGLPSSAALYAPQINLAITTAFRSSVAELFPTTIATSQEVTAGTISTTSTLIAPSFAYRVLAAALTVVVAFFAPSVATTITTDTIQTTATISPPQLGGGITTASLGSSVALYAPSAEHTITAGTIGSTLTPFAPDVALSVTTGTVSSASVLSAPETIDLTLTSGTVASGSVPYPPQLGGGIVTAFLNSAIAPHAPSSVAAERAVTTSTITSTVTIAAPSSVIAEREITTAAIGSSIAVNVPVVALRITADTIPTTLSVQQPEISYGIGAAHRSSGATLFGPTLINTFFVTIESIASTAQLTAPSIGTNVVASTIAATATLHAPTSLAHRLTTAFITSTNVFYAPSTTYQTVTAFISPSSLLYFPSLVGARFYDLVGTYVTTADAVGVIAPTTIDVVASYVTIINLVGEYRPTAPDATGGVAPQIIDIVGETAGMGV